MFRWLFSLFGYGNKKMDVYTPSERRIYRYWKGDGIGWINADPMVLYRNLMEVRPELVIDIKVANSPMKDAAVASRKAVEKIKAIFDVEDYAHGGLTEEQMYELLDHFINYASSVKKNSATSPMSRTPPESFSISGESLPTSSTSDSGSTEEGFGTGEQVPSPSVPA